MTHPSDPELVARWQAGDQPAGVQLFDRHFAVVNSFLRDKAPEDVVDDLVQATFLGVLEAKEKLRPGTELRVFLLFVARRRLYSYYRTMMGASKFDPAISRILDVKASATSVIAQGEVEALLREALDALPIEQRVILDLRYFQDLKVVDVADVLECPVGTAKTRLRRAKQMLSEWLTDRYGAPRARSLLRSGGVAEASTD